MNMILGEFLKIICTIISNSASPPSLRQTVVEFSYHHHISLFGSSAFGSFSSPSLEDSISDLVPSFSADDTVVTGPIPSLDFSMGITVTF